MNIINEQVTAYLDGFYQPPTAELGKLRLEAEAARVPIILKDTEGLLLNLIRMKRPQRILEVGTAVGYSACCFAAAWEGTQIVTIEYNEETAKVAQQNIEKLGYSQRIQVYQGDGSQVMERLSKENDSPFDLIFIDAAKSHYQRFWESALPLAKKDALILCDNVLMKAMTVSNQYDVQGKHKTNIRKMREFVQYIHQLDYCHTAMLPIGDGLSISLLQL
ncbi:O-methyltransferase [Aminipila butyrica]|uniref:tRNA 5-hydroxyuridine methyltransferase n=1 Tax=Aminipila butyrica TaxID=433296 RepID=A0A858BXK3_9FIRM|nr:O-methyltransferase [Aminipila butyrica]QIB69444.1 O-methyltransferase [Aminipila butyrica]